MITLADLRPGDLMFARHVSPKAVDLGILAGQMILGQPGFPHHVGVVTQASSFELHRDGAIGPKIVQAMPNGAEEIEIGPEHWTKDYIYVRPDYEIGMTEEAGYSGTEQGRLVAFAAQKYKDTPYSFADYAAIAGVHFGIKNGPIRRYVTSSKHMICSQLADQALTDAGFHAFTDGRLPQDVTPSALFARLLALPGQHVIPSYEGWITN